MRSLMCIKSIEAIADTKTDNRTNIIARGFHGRNAVGIPFFVFGIRYLSLVFVNLLHLSGKPWFGDFAVNQDLLKY